MCFKRGNDVAEVIIIRGFGFHVCGCQRDIQQVVDRLAVINRLVDELLPEPKTLLVTRLQTDHKLPRCRSESLVRFKQRTGALVEHFQVLQFGGKRFAFLFEPVHIGEQAAELGAPVADVVGPDDLMAKKFKDASGSITDSC